MNALFETLDGSVFLANVKGRADEIQLGRRRFYRCPGTYAPQLFSESLDAALYFPYRLNFGGLEGFTPEQLARLIGDDSAVDSNPGL